MTTRFLWAVVCTVVLPLVGHARSNADDADTPQAPDLRAMGQDVLEQLGDMSRKPAQGWDGREFYAWKVYLKPRASRMSRRVRKILDADWIHADDGRAVALPSKHWKRVISELCALHPELNAAEKGYRGVRVSEKRAYKIWDRRHPMPRSLTNTPSYPSLASLRSEIKVYRRRGYVIPVDWFTRERALEAQCQQELVAQQSLWKREKEQAYADIKAAADATRTALRERTDSFAETAKLAYDWMSAMQEAEEARLKKKTETLEGASRATANKLMADMAAGRRATKGRRLTSTSSYGHTVRQKWAGPRNKLIALLARQAAAAAAAEKADADPAK